MLHDISSFARGGRGCRRRGDAACSTHTRVQISRTFARTSQPGLLPTHAALTFPCQHLPAMAIFIGTGSVGTAGCSWHPRRSIPPHLPASPRPPPIRPTCPEGPAVSQAISSTPDAFSPAPNSKPHYPSVLSSHDIARLPSRLPEPLGAGAVPASPQRLTSSRSEWSGSTGSRHA